MVPDCNFSIRSFVGGYDKNFTYLITCNATAEHLLIDASVNIKKILPFIKKFPLALLITHSHSDHISYIKQYLDFFHNLIVIGHPDTTLSLKIKNFKTMTHNQEIRFGSLNLTAIHTPGHYYDSICYQLNPVLFTGDTLFVGRTGRVVSDRSDVNHLYDSIYKKILNLPHNTIIYPGHDYGSQPTISLKDNIKISPLLNAKNRNNFIDLMKEYEKSRRS